MKNFVLGILSAYVLNDIIKRVFSSKSEKRNSNNFRGFGQFSGVSSTPSRNFNKSDFGATPHKIK